MFDAILKRFHSDRCMTHKATLTEVQARIDKCLHNYIRTCANELRHGDHIFSGFGAPKNSIVLSLGIYWGLGILCRVVSQLPTHHTLSSPPYPPFSPFRNGFVLPLNYVSQRYTLCVCSLSLSHLLMHIYVHIYIYSIWSFVGLELLHAIYFVEYMYRWN
jgi:hypothetical protein